MKTTAQTRITQYAGQERAAGHAALDRYADLYGMLERRLFARMAAGASAASLKNGFRARYRIPARMFNALRVSVEGKIDAVKEGQRRQVDSLGRRIEKAERNIGECLADGRLNHAHQMKRRLVNLQRRRDALRSDMSAGRVRMCFGSRGLWRKQYNLEQNGYADFSAWTQDWRDARSNEFFVLGSRDETGGCLLCTASIQDDGSLTLRLRMPDCLAEQYGKYIHIKGVRFAYGHEHILAALVSNEAYSQYRREHGEEAARKTELGQAVSFRFKRDRKGWRVFATTEMMDVPVVTDQRLGAVGVDLNADHLAVAETDASGNPVNSFSVPLVTYGKSTGQAAALIGDAVAGVVEYAGNVRKPIVIERLDFRQKKDALRGEAGKYSRMLSSFSYNKVKAYFISRGYRHGVEVRQVNPAFSSIIGRVKFMERYGLSVHQAAALVLARRSLGCSERIPRRWVCPVRQGVHVAFHVPARKRVKHVWTYWGAIWGQLKPALAAQHRLGTRIHAPNPASAEGRATVRPGAFAGTSFDASG